MAKERENKTLTSTVTSTGVFKTCLKCMEGNTSFDTQFEKSGDMSGNEL